MQRLHKKYPAKFPIMTPTEYQYNTKGRVSCRSSRARHMWEKCTRNIPTRQQTLSRENMSFAFRNDGENLSNGESLLTGETSSQNFGGMHWILAISYPHRGRSRHRQQSLVAKACLRKLLLRWASM